MYSQEDRAISVIKRSGQYVWSRGVVNLSGQFKSSIGIDQEEWSIRVVNRSGQ